MTTNPLLALGEHPFLLVLEQLPPRSLFALQRVNRTWHSFVSEHTGLWAGVLRRAGVDMDEWRQVVAESKERQRLAAWEREKRESLMSEAIAELGLYDEDSDPLIISSEYKNDDPGPETFMGTGFPSTATEYRAAYKAHVVLQRAWKQRHCFETLVNTPSFRLRRIYVDGPYLFAFSKAWAGQLPEEREDTEDLHVLDKYSGRLLLTIPGNRAHAAHAVGAGHVLTSANGQREITHISGVLTPASEDDHNEGARNATPGPVGRVSIFRTREAHARAVELAALHARPTPLAYRGSAVLEFVTNTDDMMDCTTLTVTLDGEALACGAGAKDVVVLHLDSGRVERWAHGLAAPRLYAVACDGRYVVLVCDTEAHVFSLNGRSVVSFPDEREPLADLVAEIGWPWPYAFQGARRPEPPVNGPGQRAPPEFEHAETSMRVVVGYRSQSRKYAQLAHTVTHDGFRPRFRGVGFGQHDLVLWGASGWVLAVQDYRALFRSLAGTDEGLRPASIRARTIAVVEPDGLDCLAVHGERILGARAAGTMWSFSLASLPVLPAALPPLPLPCLPETHPLLLDMAAEPAHRGVWAGAYTNYDISCLAQMSARAAVALDARAAYMLDWDKGFPGGASVEYELLFREEAEHGTWPWPTRPAFGHVKVWTHRPHAAVLWTPHSRCLGAAFGSGMCGCGRRHGVDWGWGSDGEDGDEDEEEQEEEQDWQDGLDGLVQLFSGEDQDDGPDALDGVVDVLLELDLSDSDTDDMADASETTPP